jgi:pyruvate dehydrogenase E1 component alpha subunit
MSEMLGKVTGCARGRGGSMHLFHAAHRFFGGHAIVGGGLPVAVGLALADKMQKREAVTACFFGDGAAEEGELAESLNLAALWQLPVLFLCENNQYAMGTALARHAANPRLSDRAVAYGVHAEQVDGMDVHAVERVVRYCADTVREEHTPRFIELETYRFRAHSMYDADKYRSKDEIADWKKRCPIETFAEKMRAAGYLDDATLASIEQKIRTQLDDAVRIANDAALEPEADLERDVYAEPRP